MVCTWIRLNLQEVNLSNPELHKKGRIFFLLKVPSCSTVERNIEWWVSFDVFLNAIQRKPRTVLVLIEVWLLTGDCSKVNMIQVGGTMTLSNMMRRALMIMHLKASQAVDVWDPILTHYSIITYKAVFGVWIPQNHGVTSSRCLLYLWAFRMQVTGAMGQRSLR